MIRRERLAQPFVLAVLIVGCVYMFARALADPAPRNFPSGSTVQVRDAQFTVYPHRRVTAGDAVDLSIPEAAALAHSVSQTDFMFYPQGAQKISITVRGLDANSNNALAGTATLTLCGWREGSSAGQSTAWAEGRILQIYAVEFGSDKSTNGDPCTGVLASPNVYEFWMHKATPTLDSNGQTLWRQSLWDCAGDNRRGQINGDPDGVKGFYVFVTNVVGATGVSVDIAM